MATYLDLDQIRARLADMSPLNGDGYSLLRGLAAQIGAAQDGEIDGERGPLDTVIRALERRSEFAAYDAVFDSIIRQVGLFPYATVSELSVAETIAYEVHRPLHMNDYVLHRSQAEVYRLLLGGENVVLSAPTSYGKSLLIDAVIASGAYENIVVVVPTLALIDETRRRIARFQDFKVVTHPSQRIEEKNIFVFTQERLLDREALPQVDLFVVDEFYKLDLAQDADRAALLNQALLRLLETRAQFFLLGPNIEGLTPNLPDSFQHRFYRTDYRTVAADVRRENLPAREHLERLVEVRAELDGSTLVYCQSPARARKAAEVLAAAIDLEVDPTVHAAADWLAENFSPSWYVVDSLRHGVGVHHGKLPRSIAQWVVRAFNDGRLHTLICTSTLIEGVNTSAKNIVILDRRIANRAYDYFTYNNIRGRSGRMFRHFVGTVVLFHAPPDQGLPFVDIPILSQSDGAPTSMLLQLDEADMTPETLTRLEEFLDQDVLSLETLRANSGVDPARQLEVARLIGESEQLPDLLAWSGFPKYDQLRAVCGLIVDVLRAQNGQRNGEVSSGSQLAYRLSRLSAARGNVRTLIREAESENPPPPDPVESVLDFLRFWPGHNFPRLLMSIERIQREVLEREGQPQGSYAFFAGLVENLYSPAPLMALEEYGVPIQLSRRLEDVLQPKGDLDDLLGNLAALDVRVLNLGPFEVELLSDAIASLSGQFASS